MVGLATPPKQRARVPLTREQLGIRLRELREAAGLSQAELARRLTALGAETPQPNITRIEQGKMVIDPRDSHEFATVLGCTVLDLYSAPKSVPPEPQRGRPPKKKPDDAE